MLVGKFFFSTIDRYSKFVHLRYAVNKLNAHEVMEEILQIFPSCKHIMTDNDKIFVSHIMKSLFKRLKIEQTFTPIRHSTTNSQVERFHRTLIEISRCLSEQQSIAFEDVVFDAVREYNNTIHSVIQAKPIDVFYHSERYPKIQELIKSAQESMIKFQNKNRKHKIFDPGDIIFVKNDRRDKRSPTHTRHVVWEDKGVFVVTDKDKVVHKDNIRIN